MKKILTFTLVFLWFAIATWVYAKSWCCSHHKWVAYCWSNWYYMCNDWTQSPSCTCSSVTKKQTKTTGKTITKVKTSKTKKRIS
jgi:hypothetical protein